MKNIFVNIINDDNSIRKLNKFSPVDFRLIENNILLCEASHFTAFLINRIRAKYEIWTNEHVRIQFSFVFIFWYVTLQSHCLTELNEVKSDSFFFHIFFEYIIFIFTVLLRGSACWWATTLLTIVSNSLECQYKCFFSLFFSFASNEWMRKIENMYTCVLEPFSLALSNFLLFLFIAY